jgi:GNAT superfamily N-acetyltransferase
MPRAVRVATVQDADVACYVLRRSITECCVEDHKNGASVLDLWLKNKTAENVRTWFQHPGNFPVVAEVDGKIVGVALMSKSGEVALCYLVPEARFIGAGKALLSLMEMEAARRGVGSLHLESTATARAFYLRNGFLPSGEPKEAFGITTFPMRKKLSLTEKVSSDG